VQGEADKTIWRRIGLIAILLPVCFFFPLALILVGLLAWSIYEDLKPPKYPLLPPPRTLRDAKPEDDDWLILFCEGCESPAEEQFLRAMVKEFYLKPDNGVLKSPKLTLEMQVKVANYRYDFLLNGRQVIEVDGAAYHSSPEQVERDRIRDEHSMQDGYKVLRIPASVVFKTPDEGIRRVKAALAETPSFTKPQRMKPVNQKRTAVQYMDAFFDGLNKINRNVEIVGQTRKATEAFLAAIEHEQMLLDALVANAEMDQRVKEMSPRGREILDELSAQMRDLVEKEKPLSEIYKWEKIVKPAPADDAEIQQKIEAAYENAMEERNKRFAELKERCAKDPVFTQLFCRKLVEARFPVERPPKSCR
jgi:very-short-patch-repair endonuclease